MGWTVTSLAARAGRAVGIRPTWTTAQAVARAQQAASRTEGEPLHARLYARRLAAASPADRKALEAAVAELGPDGAVIEHAAATGAPLPAVAALAAAWERLPGTAKDTIRHPAGTGVGPVRLGATRAVQVDATTSGAAVMAMMTMMGDPFVAAWVATGRSLGSHLPPEVGGAVEWAPRTIEERWQTLQRVLHTTVTRSALGPLAWPSRFGTPPWRLDNVIRFAGLKFRGAMLDDSSADTMDAAITHASSALHDGIPVPMYTGGDSSGGLDQVVPRHVVLLTSRTATGFTVYEPSSGRVLPLETSRLLGGGPAEPAFGAWTRACWMILPRPSRR